MNEMFLRRHESPHIRVHCPANVVEFKGKVKFSRCRPGVAQRVSTGMALLFHDRGTRRG